MISDFIISGKNPRNCSKMNWHIVILVPTSWQQRIFDRHFISEHFIFTSEQSIRLIEKAKCMTFSFVQKCFGAKQFVLFCWRWIGRQDPFPSRSGRKEEAYRFELCTSRWPRSFGHITLLSRSTRTPDLEEFRTRGMCILGAYVTGSKGGWTYQTACRMELISTSSLHASSAIRVSELLPGLLSC